MAKFFCVVCGKDPLHDRISLHRNKDGEWVCREHLDEPLPDEVRDICDIVLADGEEQEEEV